DLQNWMDNLAQTCPPYGESLSIVQDRVASFLDDLRKAEYKKVLLVTHAGPIRCMWNYLLQTPINNTFKVPVDYNEVFHFNLGATPQDDFILQKA
ncbi:histidine phosphatase family protein, partial [Myroides odoratimimus]